MFQQSAVTTLKIKYIATEQVYFLQQYNTAKRCLGRIN